MNDLLNTVAAFFKSFFDGISYGVDVATAVAILGSMGAFLYAQYKRSKSAKKLSLNEAVRSTALSEISVSVRDLARIYQAEVGSNAMLLNGDYELYRQRFVEGSDNDIQTLRKFLPLFQRSASYVHEMLSGREKFLQLISAEMYVFFGLLDSYGDGSAYIKELRENRAKLITLGNDLGDYLNLFEELHGFLALVAENGNDFSAFSDDVKADAIAKLQSIIQDSDYRDWVNLFIPSDKQEDFWRAAQPGEKSGAEADVLNSVFNNVMVNTLAQPGNVMTSLIDIFVSVSQDIQRQCKEALIVLAATTHSLTLAEEERIDLAKIVERYESDDYFALGSETT